MNRIKKLLDALFVIVLIVTPIALTVMRYKAGDSGWRGLRYPGVRTPLGELVSLGILYAIVISAFLLKKMRSDMPKKDRPRIAPKDRYSFIKGVMWDMFGIRTDSRQSRKNDE